LLFALRAIGPPPDRRWWCSPHRRRTPRTALYRLASYWLPIPAGGVAHLIFRRRYPRWAALQRAEARLAAGSYGRSVRSGQAIPDERLQVEPLAKPTVEEAATAERGALEQGDDAVGLVSAGHPFEVLAEADITPEEEYTGEDDDEPAPEPSLGIHIERDDRAR
jgi:hypothetical protein